MTMTQSPDGLVPEGKEVTFTCLTDESNPTASVTWTLNGSPISSTNDEIIPGDYKAFRRQSVLKVTSSIAFNNSRVRCVVNQNIQIGVEKTITVEGM